MNDPLPPIASLQLATSYSLSINKGNCQIEMDHDHDDAKSNSPIELIELNQDDAKCAIQTPQTPQTQQTQGKQICVDVQTNLHEDRVP